MKLSVKEKFVIENFTGKKSAVSRTLISNGEKLYWLLYSKGTSNPTDVIAEWINPNRIRIVDTSNEGKSIRRYLAKKAITQGIDVIDPTGKKVKLRNISLTALDKKVIESFFKKKPMSSKKLSTDGYDLECLLTNVILIYWDDTGNHVIRNYKRGFRVERIFKWHETVGNFASRIYWKSHRKSILDPTSYKRIKEEKKEILRDKLSEFNYLRNKKQNPYVSKIVEEAWNSGLIDEEIRRVEEAIFDLIHSMPDN